MFGCGVGEVVSGDVDSLNRGDGARGGGGGDALLQLAHLRRERGLVPHGGRDAPEEGRDFGAGLAEPEDIVNKEQRFGAAEFTEVFGHGETGKGDAEAGARRLVHLSEDETGVVEDGCAGVSDLRVLHFEPEVVAFAGSFADAGEDGVAAMLGGDACDEFLDHDGLADAGTAEQAGLAAFDEGTQQVDDLDAGLEEFALGGQLDEFRGVAMDWPAVLHIDGAAAVDRLAEDVENASQGFLADGDLEGIADVDDFHAAAEAEGGAEGNRTNAAGAEMLLHFADQFEGLVLVMADDFQGVEYSGQLVAEKLGIENAADNLYNSAFIHCIAQFFKKPAGGRAAP
jgi:hypothetical protein